jgi:hypothetical protein
LPEKPRFEGDWDMKGKLIVLFGIVLIAMAVCPGEVEGRLFDVVFYDDAVVSSAEWYDFVTVYDSPPDRTTIELYGRGDGLITHDSSTVNVHAGGAIGENWGDYESELYRSSTVNVYEGGGFYGGSGSRLQLYDSSTLNIYGGEIDVFLFLYDSSTVNMRYGRSMFGFILHDESTLNLSGGYMHVFMGNSAVLDKAVLNIYGYDFTYEPQGRWVYLVEPADGWWVSKLTGYALDGEPFIYWGIPDPSTNPNINLIPEPGTALLLSLGSLGLLRRRNVNGQPINRMEA